MSNKLTHVKKKKVQEEGQRTTDGKKALTLILVITLILILVLFLISS